MNALKSLLLALFLFSLCAQGHVQDQDDEALVQTHGDEENTDHDDDDHDDNDDDEDDDNDEEEVAQDIDEADLAQVSKTKTKWSDIIKDRTSPDYFEYPACLPKCLNTGILKQRNAAGKRVKFPMYMKKGSVYKVFGKCYLAKTHCFGCIGHPKRYPRHLKKLSYCPSEEVKQLWTRLKTFRHYAIKQWLTKTKSTAKWLRKAIKIKISPSPTSISA
eukprot:TRINITY_DN418_c0_g1_i4.p1 TRINITY_DN418_c0_g1~~TRINITY_DN418_c0_g1_i4.p1  ORF type:complete len:217 (-),score=50.72 TRINITY_DN418_c0_g1_i4:98-748(-)